LAERGKIVPDWSTPAAVIVVQDRQAQFISEDCYQFGKTWPPVMGPLATNW
jgi:hypothetical protein